MDLLAIPSDADGTELAIARRGSQTPKDRHPDPRDTFDSDLDKLKYTESIRRLEFVTQVMPAGTNYRFHSRSTHTNKVAQVAGAIANRLLYLARTGSDAEQAERRALIEKFGGLNPTVAKAGGLIHDLGHPPFGHLGESVLDKFAQRIWGIPGGPNRELSFEGNAQSFRTVMSLEQQSKDEIGLKLSPATLNAGLKYPWQFQHGLVKYSCYQSEKNHWANARSYVVHLENKRTLEAQIVDLADDISYAVHDVEDFFRAGLIPLVKYNETARWDRKNANPPRWLIAATEGLAKAWLGEMRSIVAQLGTPQLAAKLTLPVSECVAITSDASWPEIKLGLDELGPVPDMDGILEPLTTHVLSDNLPTFSGDMMEVGKLRAYSSGLINFLLGSIQFSDLVGATFSREGRIVVSWLKWLVKEYVFTDPHLLNAQAAQRHRLESVVRFLANSLGLHVMSPFESVEESDRLGALHEHLFLSEIPDKFGSTASKVADARIASWPLYFQGSFRDRISEAPKQLKADQNEDEESKDSYDRPLTEEETATYRTGDEFVRSRLERARLVLDAVAWMGEGEVDQLYSSVIDHSPLANTAFSA
jgi:predicted deoxyguanosinetriphosphate triphosphohydrolase